MLANKATKRKREERKKRAEEIRKAEGLAATVKIIGHNND